MKLLIDTDKAPSKIIRKWVFGFAARNGGLKTGKKFKKIKGTKEYIAYYGRLAALGRAAQKRKREEHGNK